MDGIHYFLTYPTIDLDSQALYDFLKSIKPIVWARVAKERHADGQLHSHVILRFGKRHKTSTDRREFDFMGKHPNVQLARNFKDVLEYVSKDGNYIDFGNVPEKQAKYQKLKQFAQAGDRDGFDECAMDMGVSFQWASHIWQRFGTTSNTISEAGEGTECLQLQSLQYDSGSVLIVGPSGCGKSSWAKRVCPKPALWVRHLDDLKKLSKEHKSIIFDDMEFSHLPRSTQIYIVDQDDIATIHCRHANALIPKNMPKIFTANNYPFMRDPAIERRLKTINILSFAL